MIDGRDDPTEQVRSALSAARDIAAKGKNNLLAYLIEAALAELDVRGLEPTGRDKLPTRSVV